MWYVATSSTCFILIQGAYGSLNFSANISSPGKFLKRTRSLGVFELVLYILLSWNVANSIIQQTVVVSVRSSLVLSHGRVTFVALFSVGLHKRSSRLTVLIKSQCFLKLLNVGYGNSR